MPVQAAINATNHHISVSSCRSQQKLLSPNKSDIKMNNPTYSEGNSEIQSNSTITHILVATISCMVLVLIGRFHWNRRKLYKAAAKLKGPPTLPIIGNALLFMGDTTRIFQNILNLFHDYPYDLVRVWLGTKLLVIVTEPEYMEIVLNSPRCLEKDSFYDYSRVVVGEGIFSAPVAKWKKNRKLISPAFNQKILDSFMGIFNEQTKIFLKILESKVGMKSLNIYHLVSAMTVDSLCESAMGMKVGCQSQSAGLNVWMDTIMMVVFMRMADIWYSYDFVFNMTKWSKILKDSVTRLHQFTHKVVLEKRKQFDERMQKQKSGEEICEEELKEKKTFLNLLLQLTHEGTKMTDDELRHEVDTFTIAGTDTTASTLSFCYVMLGMHPELQEKIREEVIDILGEDRDVTAEDLSRLNLLERFIKETIRIFPVGPILVRTTDQDMNLGKHQIPAGCSIVLACIRVHRNPEIWKDPLKFDPDRFLPEETAKRHPYSYLPFSGGPRNCIGYKYAMMTMKTTLAMTLRKFVVMTEYKTIEEIRLMINIVLKPTDGYKVYVKLRE